ncbi:MAG: dephospho-CoA kinase [Spirochaetota bacterium]
MIVGVTGKICAGKNRVADLLAERGWYVIDVDLVGHQVLLEEKSALVSLFGSAILDETGEVSRKAVGDVVFRDPGKLAMLEAAIHPAMVERCRELAEARDQETFPQGTVLNAAVLYKMGLDQLCSAVLYVRACVVKRLNRARAARGMTTGEFLRRNAAQRHIAPKYFYGDVPIYVIINNHGDPQLKEQLEAFSRSIRSGEMEK